MLKILERAQLFKGTRYSPIVEQIEAAAMVGDNDKVNSMAEVLPTDEQLLEELTVELKGKPVLKTIKRTVKGNTKNAYEAIKGLFSLGTHIAIECEKGNTEYIPLLYSLHEKIGSTIFNLENKE